MSATKTPKRFSATDLDNGNIAAGAGIVSSKLADGANFLNRNGSVALTGNVDLANNKLVNVGTATAGTDGVNLGQLNTLLANALNPFTSKGTVRAATTANITLSATQTIDGVAVVAGERVLVKNQTTASQNGIYVVAAGAWTRAVDMDAWSEVPGAWLTVQQGTTQADTVWLGTADQGGTLDSTAITFVNPIQAGGLNASNFVFNETPSGTVNGSNTAFTLANTPVGGTVCLYIEGTRLRAGAGNDYTISGAALTLLTAPLTGENLIADYMK